ncbi:DNA-binding protein [Burkholderia anthina]|uniref:DNA-binding protein n=1 Tax=Burkholderia anthina TaxID=179879 RepID=A0A6P2GFV8_9BURK|nr:DNA-binding protein [Burkholderia anthina]MBM2769870.1 DNA-binding protein [Burkholderia anthina]VVU51844.1 putative phage DNA-binding protein [Burkholderia anthina]
MSSRRINSTEVVGVLAKGTHTARQIAAELQTSTAFVQSFLDTLFYAGRIRIDRRVTTDTAYELTPIAAPRAPLDTPAAGPRLAPNLQSTLAGYDREISRRVKFAMTTRGK